MVKSGGMRGGVVSLLEKNERNSAGISDGESGNGRG